MQSSIGGIVVASCLCLATAGCGATSSEPTEDVGAAETANAADAGAPAFAIAGTAWTGGTRSCAGVPRAKAVGETFTFSADGLVHSFELPFANGKSCQQNETYRREDISVTSTGVSTYAEDSTLVTQRATTTCADAAGHVSTAPVSAFPSTQKLHFGAAEAFGVVLISGGPLCSGTLYTHANEAP